MPPCHRTAAFLSQTGHKHCSVRCRKDLCHTLSPPLSQASPPHSWVLVHATTLLPSLLILSQTPHCILPIMPVLHWCVPRTFWPCLMFTHSPAGLNQGHCLARSLIRSRCVRWYPVHPARTVTHTLVCSPHTQGLFSIGTQGKGCHSDKRPNPSHRSPQHPSLMEAQTFFLKFYSKCGMCECAFPSYSWHSQRRW